MLASPFLPPSITSALTPELELGRYYTNSAWQAAGILGLTKGMEGTEGSSPHSVGVLPSHPSRLHHHSGATGGRAGSSSFSWHPPHLPALPLSATQAGMPHCPPQLSIPTSIPTEGYHARATPHTKKAYWPRWLVPFQGYHPGIKGFFPLILGNVQVFSSSVIW